MRNVLLLVLLAACATPQRRVEYALFEPLPGDDVFALAIGHWQAETRLEDLVAEVADLRAELKGDRPPQPSEARGGSALGVDPSRDMIAFA